MEQYLGLFRTRHEELLQLGQLSQEYPDTVATTWSLSFQNVQEASPPAADLLNLCAFLAPNNIPKKIIEKGSNYLPTRLAQAVQDPLAMNIVLAKLRRYSLMEVNPDSLSVHRLVQAVVRDRLDQNAQKDWVKIAAEAVNSSLMEKIISNPEIWPWIGRLTQHALVVAERAWTLQTALPIAARLMNQIGYYLSIRSEFNAAKLILEKAISIGEIAYGKEHPWVAIAATNLGNVLRSLNDLETAKALAERALKINLSNYGPSHSSVANDLNNLGTVLRDMNDLAGAKKQYERSIGIIEAIHGPNHLDLALKVNNLGTVLLDMGDLEGSKTQLNRYSNLGFASSK